MGKEDGVGDGVGYGWQEEEGGKERERGKGREEREKGRGREERERGKGGEGRKREGKDRRKQKKAGYWFKAWAMNYKGKRICNSVNSKIAVVAN